MGKETDKGYILLYDISQLPKYLDVDNIMRIVHEHGICLYDSSNGAGGENKPSVVHAGGKKNEYLKGVKFFDLKNPDYTKPKTETNV